MSEDVRVALPLDVPPVVVGLGVGLHGVRRRFERWQLPALYSLHLYSYRGELAVNRRVFEIRPGWVSLVPPGAVMEYRYQGPSEHLYAHLGFPPSQSVRAVPLMQNLGPAAPAIAERVRAATFLQNSGHRAAELWSVLWAIALLAETDGAAEVHPAVSAAIRHIDAHLRDSLTVSDIAAATRFSVTHLDRVFRAATGRSVSSYLRDRRMSTARHLLEETTQSISSVATSVGIGDLQAFNKACRHYLGGSPRAIRARGASVRP